MKKTKIAAYAELEPNVPAYALVENVDLVVVRGETENAVTVLYGRCQHRGALMSDGAIQGKNLVCGVHGSTYVLETGKNVHYPGADLKKFDAWVEDGSVWVDADEVRTFELTRPQKYQRDEYQGLYADFKGTEDEPHVKTIRGLASHGLELVGMHGPMAAMGVPRGQLPSWDDIQILTAQLHRFALLDDAEVNAKVIVGPRAKKPLTLDMPLLVSDMSFGSLSREAKIALSLGADKAGTGICSGEGGMLEEERAQNHRYFYELASARFGYSMDKVKRCQAFHFKGGQGAKTGTGGHLPARKVTEEIASVRGLAPGQDAVSPARFPDWDSVAPYKEFAARVREETGGIPVGFKLSAQHIEKDIDAALEIGVDYIILDGRGGGTGAAPLLFRDNISVPTMAALARARRHLDNSNARDVTLIITGGLRIPADFIKALSLGANAIAIANSAMQAIGCLGMRACHTNNCPVGIATQKPSLRARLIVDEAALRLVRFLRASVHLMQVMARACGHDDLGKFDVSDLTTFNPNIAQLTGIAFGGVSER